MKRVSSGLKFQPLNGVATFFTSLIFIVLFVWSFDSATFRDVLNARQHLGRRFESAGPLVEAPRKFEVPVKFEKSLVQNETQHINASTAVERVQQTLETAASPQQVLNQSWTGDGVVADSEKKLDWIRFPDQEEETETLLQRLAENGTKLCHAAATARIVGLGLEIDRPVELRAGIVHRFVFTAYDEKGEPRCSGGDYFETDLSGSSWKSRPPVADLGNGSYSMSLQVDPRFAKGLYRLKIVLLFGNYNASSKA